MTPSLRDHERERTKVPGAAFKFDELSLCQILADEVSRQVSPAEAGLEKVTLGAEIIDQPATGTEEVKSNWLCAFT
jgi:hypothetical protein